MFGTRLLDEGSDKEQIKESSTGTATVINVLQN